MSKRKTNEQYIQQANEVHNNKYDYSLIHYKTTHDKIEIICKNHGVFWQNAKNHLNGSNCPKCVVENIPSYRQKDTKQFIKECIEIHGDTYDYSLVDYTSALKKVKIICKTHGEFEQRAVSHIRGIGCPSCSLIKSSQKQTLTTEIFIERARLKHGDTYDYSKSEYIDKKSKVLITCPIHGEFYQTPESHLKGTGCTKCGRKKSAEYKSLNPPGWHYSSWIKAAKKSKHFDSFKVYILRCWNENEEFFKVGKTFRTVKERYRKKLDLPYRYEILETIIFEDGRECCQYEQDLKNEHIDSRYFPLKFFGGNHECFKNIKLKNNN